MTTYAVLLLSALAWAQPPADTSAVLPDIEIRSSRSRVTAGRFPAAVTLARMSETRLDLDAGDGLNRRLAGLPGLQIDNRETQALGERLLIRGVGARSPFGVRGLTVLLDGIPLTFADGSTTLEPLEPAHIRQIELVRGPTGLAWGNASGGTLFLESAPSEPGTRIALQAGAFGDMRLQAATADSTSHFRISHARTRGWRHHSASSLFRAGGSRTTRWGTTTFLALHMPQAQNPGGLNAARADTSPRSAHTANLDRDAGKTGSQFMIGHRMGSTSFHAGMRTTENPIVSEHIALRRWVGGIRSDRELGLGFTAGFDASGLLEHRTETPWENASGTEQDLASAVETTSRYVQAAPFLIWNRESGAWYLQLGLRPQLTAYRDAERWRSTWAPVGSAGLSYRVGTWTAFGNWRSSAEAPTLNERFNAEGGRLQAESSANVEIGFRGLWSARLQAEAAVYLLRVRDRIQPVQQPDGSTRYRNADGSDHLGLELALLWLPTDAWEVRLGGHRARFRNTDGSRLPGAAETLADAALTWRMGAYSVSTRWRHRGHQYADEANTLRDRPATTGDLLLGWQLPGSTHLHVSVQANNLTDRRYNGSVVVNPFGGRAYEPAPGRHLLFGFSWRY